MNLYQMNVGTKRSVGYEDTTRSGGLSMYDAGLRYEYFFANIVSYPQFILVSENWKNKFLQQTSS